MTYHSADGEGVAGDDPSWSEITPAKRQLAGRHFLLTP
jgi:hypothetical protein